MKRGLVFWLIALVSICLYSLADAENLNETSVSCSAPSTKLAISGSKISFSVTAEALIPAFCDSISECSFDILENPASETSAALTGLCSGESTIMEFNWQTSDDDTGTFYIIFSFKDTCAQVETCITKVELFPNNCISATIGEAYASPGGKASLPVEILAPSVDVGGFVFCIEYYPAILTFVSLERGEFFNAIDTSTGGYLWHYLVWRNNPSTDLNKYRLCIVGIGKLYYYEGRCLPQGGKGVMNLVFRLTNKEIYSCLWTPVTWTVLDTNCIFNAFASCSGYDIYLFNDSLYYNPEICDPAKSYPVAKTINCVKSANGRIIFKCDPQWIRGDINRNGFVYEIGDAITFINYFIFGNEAFDPNPYFARLQTLSTDINRDGIILALSDLTHLQRILSGDDNYFPLGELQFPILPPYPNTIQALYNGRTVETTNAVDLGTMHLIFKGEASDVKLLTSGLEIKWGVSNGETKAVIYSFNRGGKIPAGASHLLEISGEVRLEKVEAAEYMGTPVNVESRNFITIPQTFSLSQNYPNPFNHSTIIKYALPKDGKVSLKIYNISGQLVKEFSEYKSAGYYSIFWDGTNSRGEKVSSGVYLYKLETENLTEVKKMTLLK